MVFVESSNFVIENGFPTSPRLGRSGFCIVLPKSPTSRKRREKWGTHGLASAGESYKTDLDVLRNGEDVSVGIFEPCDFVSRRGGPDSEFVLLEESENLEVNTFLRECPNNLLNV